jgi:hypothetical protein
LRSVNPRVVWRQIRPGSTLRDMMKPRFVPLILVAGAALACRASDEKAPPAAKPAGQPVEKTLSMPAMPIMPAGAKPEPKAAGASDPRSARFDALQTEYVDAQQNYYTAFRSALGDNQNPTAEQLEKIRSELKPPDPKDYCARAHQLVDEDPTDLAAFHALGWLLDNEQDVQVDEANGTATVSPGQGRAAILALLEKHHMQRAEMGEMCSRLSQLAPPMLTKLLASSPHVEVRGQACYALAEGLKQDIETADYLKKAEPKDLEGMKSYLGAEKVAALQTLDVEQTQKTLEQHYERVVKEFGDVKVDVGTKHETTLGKRAGAALHEMRDLAVGKPSPEIAGVDLDSVAFKLSDYRGKVVLLDFWGNW